MAFAHVQKSWEQPNWLDVFKELLRGDRNSSIKVFMVFASAYLLWHVRHKLSHVAFIYGFCSLAMVSALGYLLSISRFVYAISSLSLALGLLLSYHRRWGFALIGLFAILLASFAVRFAGWRWVA